MIRPAIALAFFVSVNGCSDEQEQESHEPIIETKIEVSKPDLTVTSTHTTENLEVTEVLAIEEQPTESGLVETVITYTLKWVETQQGIPQNANQYKADVIRFTQASFGINAPFSLAGAQIHKESTWRENAESPYAKGLSQFTPQTQTHVKQRYPELAYGDVLNPIWAIQAMNIYNAELKTAVDAIDECNDWAFTLAMYNGGSGWIWREKNLAEADGVDRNQYWQAVELYNAGRRESAKKENRGYPKKIILELQMLYYNEGWGGILVCTDDQ